MKSKTNAKRKQLLADVKTSDAHRAKTGKNLKGKRTTSPENQKTLKKLGLCGAIKRRQDSESGHTEYCRRKAGWGTDHPGIGCCKNHGGNTATARASAERRRQIKFMGRPKEISPLDAIVWAIKITAGEVEWLSQQIAEINNKADWYEFTVAGKQMHVLVRYRADAQDRLVKYSKDAISLGLAERAVRLAEQFGVTIAKLLDGIAGDLQLTEKQKAIWPTIVRKHLILLESASAVSDEDRKEPLQITSGKAA